MKSTRGDFWAAEFGAAMVLGRVCERTQNLQTPCKSHRINRPRIFVRSHNSQVAVRVIVRGTLRAAIILSHATRSMDTARPYWTLYDSWRCEKRLTPKMSLFFVPSGFVYYYFEHFRPRKRKAEWPFSWERFGKELQTPKTDLSRTESTGRVCLYVLIARGSSVQI